jgi:type II secretory pathway component GspD/PulD (secretin)
MGTMSCRQETGKGSGFHLLARAILVLAALCFASGSTAVGQDGARSERTKRVGKPAAKATKEILLAQAGPEENFPSTPPKATPKATGSGKSAKAASGSKAAGSKGKARPTSPGASRGSRSGPIELAQNAPPLSAAKADSAAGGPIRPTTGTDAKKATVTPPLPADRKAVVPIPPTAKAAGGKTEKAAPPPGAPGPKAAAAPDAGAAAAGGAAPPGRGPAPAAGPAGAPGAPPAAAAAPADPGEAPEEPVETIMPRPGQVGAPVMITKGPIPLMEFLEFLADTTGLPLLHNSSDPNIPQRVIQIASDIKEANEEVVKAILEINGFRVYRETLQLSQKEVLKVESMQAAAPTAEDPKEIKIVRQDEAVRGDIERPASDEYATMVFTLKYTAPKDAATALNALIQRTPGIGGAAPGGAGGRMGTKTFSMVDVQNTMMLIITAKYGLLSYIRELLKLIDVPYKEPERIIHMIDVQEASASELVSIIQEFLQGQSRGGIGSRGRRSSRQIPGQPIAPQGPQGAVPSQTGIGGSSQYDYYQTSLIADERTNKIIIETYSEQDLQDINMLVTELDIRFDLRRLRTHIYQVRYLKATEVAGDLMNLLQSGGGFGSMRGMRGGAATGRSSRTSTAGRFGTRQARTSLPTTAQPGGTQTGGGQNAPLPSLIVPHEPTNSLLIQAEPEEYDEILNVLSKIDTKRRQVFLEAALVQVTSASNLNYTIELLAGNPDDQATRTLFASSFGLSGIDFDNFNRVVGDLSDPAAVPPGGLMAIMSRGKLPAIIRFFKQNRDSQVLATPFVLADDNNENIIDITETRYVSQTNTVNTSTTTSTQGEDAGITLAITPTISGSERAVFLTMDLTVSEFAEATAAASTLPPKSANTMTSSVTIPDGEVFVVGGLTRQSKSKSVSKVPILGDIPILGKLFRSESTAQSQNNLYVFLQAHILTDEEFQDGIDLTRQAEKKMHLFDSSLQPVQYDKPKVERRAKPADDEAERTMYRNPSREGMFRDSTRPTAGRSRQNLREPVGSRDSETAALEGAPDRAEAPAARPKTGGAKTGTRKTAQEVKVIDRDGWLLSPVPASGTNEEE